MTGGVLAGLRVVEFAGLAPAPFAAMMLADHGAEVIRVDRPEPTVADPDLLGRGRSTLNVDLKQPDALESVRRLVDGADVLIEGFRPGVMERLGLGPEECLARNPGLVYGRMTGWGQDGPLAQTAGHDLNYIALSGALGALGPAGEPPVPPLNLVGDFGGGGMLLAFGLLAALWERQRSGNGQIVDAAMIDGAAVLTTHLHSMLGDGTWGKDRGRNILDGGAPYYRCYVTSDGRFVSVGAIEPQFYAELLRGLRLDPGELPDQDDLSAWPRMHQLFADRFATRTQQEWTEIFGASDACVHPVLDPTEAHEGAHARARGTFVSVDGMRQPAPAPRFDRTPSPAPRRRTAVDHTQLRQWGLDEAQVAKVAGPEHTVEEMRE